MAKRRVVVTGMGMISPVGNTVAESWASIKAGKSGIGDITLFDTSAYSTRFAGEVKGLDLEKYLSKKESRRMDRFIQFGLVAGIQAFEDAKLDVTADNASRIGVAIGSGMGGIGTIESTFSEMAKSGLRKVSPFFVPGTIINMISGNLSIKYGLKGPNIAITTACTTGVHNIGHAARMIAYNDADVMVAGGTEAAITQTSVAGFAAAKALSTNNDNPQQASCPWDKDRDGFVMGEGAGVIVIEEYEHAKARGAHIYAELTGFGMSADAYHMTSPPSDGEGAAAAMVNAINDAGIERNAIGYINAHGTSTNTGDRAETSAVKSVFGAHAYDLGVSSTKSMTGHLLGAAGSVEAIFTILALIEQVMPPTINLKNPDEGCDLDFVTDGPRAKKLDHALCNSFGFGGTNGSLLFSRIKD